MAEHRAIAAARLIDAQDREDPRIVVIQQAQRHEAECRAIAMNAMLPRMAQLGRARFTAADMPVHDLLVGTLMKMHPPIKGDDHAIDEQAPETDGNMERAIAALAHKEVGGAAGGPGSMLAGVVGTSE